MKVLKKFCTGINYRLLLTASQCCLLLFSCLFISQLNADEHDLPPGAKESSTDQVVDYPASFFSRYQPDTALDMVNQLPGFLLNNGTSDRGFIGAIGNILINGTYPSVKQDTPSFILARIPASQVEKIEIIRGQVRGIDMQGQAVVANIILQENSGASLRWLTYLQKSNQGDYSGPFKPAINISLSHKWNNIDYNLGLNLERESNGERGRDLVLDGNGDLLETRIDRERQTGVRLLGVTLNTSTLLGETLFNFNSKFSLNNGPDNKFSTRISELTGIENEVYFKDSQTFPAFELGVDAERSLSDDLNAKTILLYTNRNLDLRNFQSNNNAAGIQTSQRIADSNTLTQEGIVRIEFDWDGINNHNLQFNSEGAYNSVDRSLIQTVDNGTGPVVVDVPGANSRVEEYRGDIAVKDTWVLGNIELDYGLGAEISRITQSGDTEQSRNFFFIKPQVVLTYSNSAERLSRLLVSREVAQLDFSDFISATVFEDDDLALGNPDLRPDKTWIVEMSHERRFGGLGIIKLTAFHHWINDLLDLLPLSDTFEAPGNIGNARKWGIIMESTVPVEWLGLSGARLDLKARWQDSTVIDPVTGQKRVLSASQIGFGGPPVVRFRDNGNEHVFDIAFRQDLEASRVAWGWDIAAQADRPRFKVNELEIFNEGVEFNMFIETTKWFDIKVRLEANNILNYKESRDRTLYSGRRGLSAVSSQILRNRTPGSRLKLILSGNF
ncbi:MAG: hypothetical protein ACI9XC_001400 [Gammaproteobacteria bacterium]|jgi:hypothetical protein